MPTQSLTSDDLAARITEVLEAFNLDHTFSMLMMSTGIHVSIYVDERFTGAHKIASKPNDIHVIYIDVDNDDYGDDGATLHDALLAAYTALLAASAPLAVTA